MTGHHAERAHALLSASGSSRWMACTPSALLEDEYMKALAAKGQHEKTSEYAEEGTSAHELSELILAHELGKIKKATFTRRINKFQKENKYYSEEMMDYVTEYTDFVMERVNAAKLETPDAVALIEQRLDFSKWIPHGFGTGDMLIISEGKLEIIDLKYGKGVPVSADYNKQMMIYALGAIAEHDFMYDIQDVSMTIVQPRLDSISTYESTAKELLDWAENELKPKAQMAIKGEGEFVPGDHCRFCKVKATCRARADQALEQVKSDFDDEPIEPALLSNDEIADLLFVVDGIKKWAEDVKAYALDQSVNHGQIFDGWKVVEGRSNRKYTNESSVLETLEKEGFEKEKVTEPPKLLSISKLEKAIGKEQFNSLLSDLVVKPPGKATLVEVTDKRPAISSLDQATADFAE